jgi:hypothetical protein
MKRRTFTILRKSVNDMIQPHMVDHITFTAQLNILKKNNDYYR